MTKLNYIKGNNISNAEFILYFNCNKIIKTLSTNYDNFFIILKENTVIKENNNKSTIEYFREYSFWYNR